MTNFAILSFIVICFTIFQTHGCPSYSPSQLETLPITNVNNLFVSVSTTNFRVNYYQLWQSESCYYNLNPSSVDVYSTTGFNIPQIPDDDGCFVEGAQFYLWVNPEAAVCAYMVQATFVVNYSAPGSIVYLSGTVDFLGASITEMPTDYASNIFAYLATTNYAIGYYQMWQSTYCTYNINPSSGVQGATTSFWLMDVSTSNPDCFQEGSIFYIWVNPVLATIAYMVPATFVIDYSKGAQLQLSFGGTVDNLSYSSSILPVYDASVFYQVVPTSGFLVDSFEIQQSAPCAYFQSTGYEWTILLSVAASGDCFHEGSAITLWINPIGATHAYMVPIVFIAGASAPAISTTFDGTVDAVTSTSTIVYDYPVGIINASAFNTDYVVKYFQINAGNACIYNIEPLQTSKPSGYTALVNLTTIANSNENCFRQGRSFGFFAIPQSSTSTPVALPNAVFIVDFDAGMINIEYSGESSVSWAYENI